MNRAERRLQKNGQATPEMQQRVAELLLYPMSLHRQGKHEEAATAYRGVLDVEPYCADAWCNYGNVMSELWNYEDSLFASKRAIELNPLIPDAYNNIASVHLRYGDVDSAWPMFQRANYLDPKKWEFARNYLSCALYRDGLSVEKLNLMRQKVMAPFNRTVQRLPARVREKGDRIRIGYLSSDLRDHVVSNILLPVVKRLDKTKFDLCFYSQRIVEDHITSEYRKRADLWTEINDLSDAEAAALIRKDKIDILVSVSGSLDHDRPTICAHRAAPVQISMHDAGPSGLAQMDYLVVSNGVYSERGREWFSEKLWKIDPYYMVDGLGDFPDLPQVRDEIGPRFGCFNNPIKISHATLAAWRAILERVPNATLTLAYENSFSYAPLYARIQREMGDAGGRVVFYDTRSPRSEFLQRYNYVDIALDTFPFNGSTTTFQALAMGCPVVTWRGDHLISRLSAAMLEEADLHGLVCGSVEDYIETAVRMANNVESYWNMRQQTRRYVERSKLCDADAYTKKVEEMFLALGPK